MKSPIQLTPDTFNVPDVDWQDPNSFPGAGEGRRAVDRRYPQFVLSRCDLYYPFIRSNTAPDWGTESAPDADVVKRLSLSDLELACTIAEHELRLLERHGIKTPARSQYFVDGTPETGSTYSYIYTQLLQGHQLDPSDVRHADFVIPNCQSRLGYLGEAMVKSSLFLEDPTRTRNYTVGRLANAPDSPVQAYLHDLDPYISSVGPDIISAHGSVNQSYYSIAIDDIRDTLAAFRERSAAEEAQKDALLAQAQSLRLPPMQQHRRFDF